ncbi:MAG: type II toxin-antitoxin system HicA family toxin [Planctomycetota bacterium]
MKHRKLIRHLRQHGCRVAREGGGHTIWINPANGRVQPVPRYTEISYRLAVGICRKLEISAPAGER